MRADEFADVFLQVGVPRIRQRVATPACCILSTRVAVELGRRMDHPVWPQRVQLDILNVQACHLIKNLGRLPSVEEQDEAGAWIMQTAADEKSVGHMVAMVGGEGGPVLVDATLDQFNRLQHGIMVDPAWFAVDPEFFSGESLAVQTKIEDFASVVLRYTVVNDSNFGWMQSPDWWRRERWRGLAGAIEKRILRLPTLYTPSGQVVLH